MSDDSITRLAPLSLVKSVHSVRPVYPWYVETLKKKIESMGFLPQHAMCITSEGVLWAGVHRYEAAKALGLETAWFQVIDTEHLDRDAIRDNDATEGALPNQMPDLAEMIWRRLGNSTTQAQLAGELGWNRVRIAQFAALENIAKDAWTVVVTTFRENVTSLDESDVTSNVTGVTSPFTENLLRNILPLTDDQQVELCSDLADGSITKNRFKLLAVLYKARNEMCAYLEIELPELSGKDGAEILGSGIDAIWRGEYDKEWPDTAAVDRLIATLRDEWEKKHQIQLWHGDAYELAANIPDASVDLVLMDPPYNIAHDRNIDRGKHGNTDVSYDFGEWDRKREDVFLEDMARWVAICERILKPEGTGIIFTSSAFISDLRRLINESGMKVKQDLYWCKTNPVPSLLRTGYVTATETILLFTRQDGGHVFNWPGDDEALNYFILPICQGDERVKDSKGGTLHPTQKPEALIRRLLENSSRRGDMVVDLFMGVGTVPKVAKDSGRKAIGIEQDETYYLAARKRLADDD